MAKFELVMPKLGESIIEATIVRWHKKAGDPVTEDEPIADLATDKVDSEIPSPVEGVISELLYKEGDVVPVGKVIAYILTGSEGAEAKEQGPAEAAAPAPVTAHVPVVEVQEAKSEKPSRFYSPLVRSMAKAENISLAALDNVMGSGKDGRLTKQDFVAFMAKGPSAGSSPQPATPARTPATPAPVAVSAGDQVLEMDRMRKLIADHMVMSKQVSPHVTSFIEVDMTPIVRWREKNKEAFAAKTGEKLTFTPFFVEAASRCLREFPWVNASVNGYQIIQRQAVNIGMAAALPDGNLIVPVIRNADQKNLVGLAHDVNDLASRARANKLMPDDIQGGTFTITNFGSFDSLTGVPIINQPQVAIMGIGAIMKRPWVMESAEGDMIAIRHICMLSLSYDHRLVDGALAGQFLRRVRDVLQGFDGNGISW